MEDTAARLKEASENCLKAYESWKDNRKDIKAKETLEEAVHELRKVASRLEIELTVGENGSPKPKPLPIPHHRSKRRKDSSENGSDETAESPKPKIKKPFKKGPEASGDAPQTSEE